MPLFTKKIVKPGIHNVNSIDAAGVVTRKKVPITKKRIAHWANQFAEMRKAGINIPAPVVHDRNATPLSTEERAKLDEAMMKEEPGSFRNAGWWENLFPDSDGVLHGVVDVPLAKDAEKIGTTVKEVSINTMPEYIDGTGKKWEDVIYHVALVNHPIEPGQDNFKPLTPEETLTTIAMSDFVEDLPPEPEPIAMADAAGNPRLSSLTIDESDYGYTTLTVRIGNAPSFLENVKSLLGRLEKNEPTYLAPIRMADESQQSPAPENVSKAVKVLGELGIALPSDTTAENIIDRIIVAGEALIAKKKECEDEPDGSGDGKTKPKKVSGAIRMAQHEVDPNTPQGKATIKRCAADLVARSTALITSGRISQDYFDTEMKPQIDGLQMSLLVDDDGNLLPTSLEPLFKALERLPAKGALTGEEVRQDDKDPTKITVGGLAMSMLNPTDFKKTVITAEDAAEINRQVRKNVGIDK